MEIQETPLEISKLCRLCLTEESVMSPIFDEQVPTIPLPVRIMACVSIEVRSTDCLPNRICANCLYQVDGWYKFKEICETADTILKHFIQNEPVQLERITQVQEMVREWKSSQLSNKPNQMEPQSELLELPQDTEENITVTKKKTKSNVNTAGWNPETSYDGMPIITSVSSCNEIFPVQKKRKRKPKDVDPLELSVSRKRGRPKGPLKRRYPQVKPNAVVAVERNPVLDQLALDMVGGKRLRSEMRCKTCHKTFTSRMVFKLHQADHRTMQDSCSKCGRLFPFKHQLIEHAKHCDVEDDSRNLVQTFFPELLEVKVEPPCETDTESADSDDNLPITQLMNPFADQFEEVDPLLLPYMSKGSPRRASKPNILRRKHSSSPLVTAKIGISTPAFMHKKTGRPISTPSVSAGKTKKLSSTTPTGKTKKSIFALSIPSGKAEKKVNTTTNLNEATEQEPSSPLPLTPRIYKPKKSSKKTVIASRNLMFGLEPTTEPSQLKKADYKLETDITDEILYQIHQNSELHNELIKNKVLVLKPCQKTDEESAKKDDPVVIKETDKKKMSKLLEVLNIPQVEAPKVTPKSVKPLVDVKAIADLKRKFTVVKVPANRLPKADASATGDAYLIRSRANHRSPGEKKQTHGIASSSQSTPVVSLSPPPLLLQQKKTTSPKKEIRPFVMKTGINKQILVMKHGNSKLLANKPASTPTRPMALLTKPQVTPLKKATPQTPKDLTKTLKSVTNLNIATKPLESPAPMLYKLVKCPPPSQGELKEKSPVKFVWKNQKNSTSQVIKSMVPLKVLESKVSNKKTESKAELLQKTTPSRLAVNKENSSTSLPILDSPTQSVSEDVEDAEIETLDEEDEELFSPSEREEIQYSCDVVETEVVTTDSEHMPFIDTAPVSDQERVQHFLSQLDSDSVVVLPIHDESMLENCVTIHGT